MANDLNTAIVRVARNLKDLEPTSANQLLTDDEIANQLGAAVTKYSFDRPRLAYEEIVGDGTTYEWVLPDDWEADFSTIVGPPNQKIEYPAGQREPIFIDDEKWMIYDKVSPNKFRMVTYTPSASEKVRYVYTMPHYLNNASPATSIPPSDFEAVIALGTSYCCEVLATKAAGSSDASIAADSVDYRDSQLRYRQQAEAWAKIYANHVGIGGGVASAYGTTDFDASPLWPPSYGGHLTHENVRR